MTEKATRIMAIILISLAIFNTVPSKDEGELHRLSKKTSGSASYGVLTRSQTKRVVSTTYYGLFELPFLAFGVMVPPPLELDFL